jgi:hypothetical protein
MPPLLEVTMKKLLAAVSFFAALSSHAAEQTQTPVEEFRQLTLKQSFTCQSTQRIAELNSQLGKAGSANALQDCIDSSKALAKTSFAPALKTVSKNKAAVALLKDYYAAWLTAMDGIVPGAGERNIDYTQRQQAAEGNYKAIWSRFAVEIDSQ